jgi:hypothetical protein
MTAALVSTSLARSQFVRVRALPESITRRPAAVTPMPLAAVPSAIKTVGAEAVQRAQASHVSGSRAAGKPKRHDAIEFRMIFSLAFAFFLLTSVIERALPHKWMGRVADGEVRKSVFEQAREAAHISAGYAFMG